MINFSNPLEKISRYFTIKDATHLPKWNVLHMPSKREMIELTKLFEKMDIIRDTVRLPILVHCSIRPTSVVCNNAQYNGKNYNEAIGSTATKSAHIFGQACDFHVVGFEDTKGCAEMRKKIQPILEKLGLRMENITGSWIHVDTYPVKAGGKRFFIP